MALIEIKINTKGKIKRRRQHKRLKKNTGIATGVVAVLFLLFVFIRLGDDDSAKPAMSGVESNMIVEERPPLQVQLLTINEYSRPAIALEKVNSIVVHYTANPMTSAMQNRDYFEGLKDSHITKASSHFIVGLEGEIVQCIPTAEIAYASNNRNYDTLSIECCHEDEGGQFNKATYDSLVELTAWLLGKFDLTTEDIIRHYDVSGKMCPLYYVENEEQWQQFKQDVADYIEQNGVTKE